MTSKLPWVAAVLIIAAALGSWAALGVTPAETPTTPTETPTTGAATISVVSSNTVFAGSVPSDSGIENIYIVDHEATYDNAENLGSPDDLHDLHQALMEYGGSDVVINATGGSVNIPYDNTFDIVVTVKVHSDNCYDVTNTDNFKVSLVTTGKYTLSDNTMSDNIFCIDNSSPDTTWGRWNAVFNNGGAGYTLAPDESISITEVGLWLWK